MLAVVPIIYFHQVSFGDSPQMKESLDTVSTVRSKLTDSSRNFSDDDDLESSIDQDDYIMIDSEDD